MTQDREMKHTIELLRKDLSFVGWQPERIESVVGACHAYESQRETIKELVEALRSAKECLEDKKNGTPSIKMSWWPEDEDTLSEVSSAIAKVDKLL